MTEYQKEREHQILASNILSRELYKYNEPQATPEDDSFLASIETEIKDSLKKLNGDLDGKKLYEYMEVEVYNFFYIFFRFPSCLNCINHHRKPRGFVCPKEGKESGICHLYLVCDWTYNDFIDKMNNFIPQVSRKYGLNESKLMDGIRKLMTNFLIRCGEVKTSNKLATEEKTVLHG